MLRFLADENFNNQIIRGVLRRNINVDIAVLAWVQYNFDLSPNLSPFRREALNLTPLPLKGRGWGLGLYSMQLGTAILSVFRILD